jgi:hypothetical protein
MAVMVLLRRENLLFSERQALRKKLLIMLPLSEFAAKRAGLPLLILLAALASFPQTPAAIEIQPPDLNLLLQHLEDAGRQNLAQSRPYQVMRKYKVFRDDSKQPASEVVAQITFVPPDTKTYKITQAWGSSIGERIVRQLLDRETESAKKRQESEIDRANYDFVFLREERFGVDDEYVLQIVPKRKEKHLIYGQIWVDASTFRIRRLEGAPARNPSIWIKDVHITLQFAGLNGMWVPISFDAVATVRLLGQYTLAGLNIGASELTSTARIR